MSAGFVRAGVARTRVANGLLLAAALAWAPSSALAALQRPDARLENRMLRQAAAEQSRGEIARAEATLRELLTLQPSSSSAVIALERVFRRDGRLADVLAVQNEFLAREPASEAVRTRQLAVLLELDAPDALDAAVAAWIDADPASAEAYLEGARALHQVFGPERSAPLLQQGVEARGELPRLLIELGDVHDGAGRTEEAARAWARALGRDRAASAQVFRRIDGLAEGRDQAVAAVLSVLAAEPQSASRLEAGAELALREGMEEEAVRLAASAVESMEDAEATATLTAFARQADSLGRDEAALWAYERLRGLAVDPAAARSADERLAAAALAAGDTLAAIGALGRIAGSLPAGSAARGAAWTEDLRLRVTLPAAEDPAAAARAALDALAAFREEFPESPELDALSATLASRLLGLGLRAEAMEVLTGIEGPGAALERAFLLLEGGALPEGIAALQASLPELEPGSATEILSLTLALSELGPLGAALAVEVALARRRGVPAEGARAVLASADAVPAQDRPALLALGARAADDAGMHDEALALRRRIVAEFPEGREFPEAALRLARAVAAEPGGRDEAVRILESLIVSRPESPVVPGARRELRRLQEGASQ